jgi:hypothetical protein
MRLIADRHTLLLLLDRLALRLLFDGRLLLLLPCV